MSASQPARLVRPLVRAVVPVLVAASACAPAAASAPDSGSAAMTPPPAPSSSASAPAPAAADTGVIRVMGTARMEVPSDRARLRFAMETEAKSAAEAADTNAERMQAVLAAVRSAVGGDGSIGTSGYGLTPVYSRPEPGGSQTITAYRVQNHVEVTLTDVDRVGPVLDAAVRAGANRVAELSFFASDPGPARLEAIREATALARREAEVLAAALGGTLGEPLEVGVSGDMPYEAVRFRAAPMAMADTPVEAGSQTVSVTVNITFRLGGPGR